MLKPGMRFYATEELAQNHTCLKGNLSQREWDTFTGEYGWGIGDHKQLIGKEFIITSKIHPNISGVMIYFPELDVCDVAMVCDVEGCYKKINYNTIWNKICQI